MRIRTLRPLYSLAKLCLNLAVLATLGLLVRFGYSTFSQQAESQSGALKGAIILMAGIAGWALLVKLSRSGVCRYTQPSLKATTLAVIAGILILGLAGVQPIAGYMSDIGIILEFWTGWAAIWLFINPLYVIATLALIVWMVVTIRQ